MSASGFLFPTGETVDQETLSGWFCAGLAVAGQSETTRLTFQCSFSQCLSLTLRVLGLSTKAFLLVNSH